ncbi:MAG: polysaccharide pyruvyl transferase CsaB [Bacillota bacterium]
MKQRITISGYYGFGNAGDEAMLMAILQEVGSRVAADFTVISADPERTTALHGVKAIRRTDLRAIMGALRRSDLLISGGGSLLQDVTSQRNLWYYLFIMLAAKLLGKRVMVYAQGIGPLQRTTSRWATRLVLNMVDAITLRDSPSAHLLHEMGVRRPSVQVTADCVLGLEPPDLETGDTTLRAAGLADAEQLVLVAPRFWGGDFAYLSHLAAAADRLSREAGATIAFLALHRDYDRAAAHEVADRMEQPAVVLPADLTVHQILAIVGRSQLVVGVRLHALIFAAVTGVPFVGLSYDPKIDHFLAELGEKAIGRVDTVDEATVTEVILTAWKGRQELRHRLSGQMTELRKAARISGQVAAGLVREP